MASLTSPRIARMSASLTTVILSRDMDVLLQFCLAHLERAVCSADVSSHEIIVVDNASRTPTPAKMEGCPEYTLMRCDRHHAFAAGCNLAARQASGEFILFLNNDVFLLGDTLKGMFRAFAMHPDLGVCGTRLLFPDGTIQHAGVVLAPPPKGPYHVGRKGPPDNIARSRERFQAVTGACMLVRRDVYAELDGFDEFFKFGYEDVDLCLRAGQRGYAVRCMQDSNALHFESMTPGRVDMAAGTLEQFFERWLGRYTIDG
jgi:GT2 family glycosyltransferase